MRKIMIINAINMQSKTFVYMDFLYSKVNLPNSFKFIPPRLLPIITLSVYFTSFSLYIRKTTYTVTIPTKKTCSLQRSCRLPGKTPIYSEQVFYY